MLQESEYEIIYNAVDIDKFKFDSKIRNEIRKKMNVEDKFVIGNIGRFELQKNHNYLLKIMKQLKNQKNIVLWLIGEGKLEDEIKKIIMENNLEGEVEILGVRNDVSKLYQAMDLFLLPSLYEGLPVVGIESQISGLDCIFSDKITKELKKNSKVKYIGIDKEDLVKWSNTILELINSANSNNRNIDIKDFECFDIKFISEFLEKKYYEFY